MYSKNIPTLSCGGIAALSEFKSGILKKTIQFEATGIEKLALAGAAIYLHFIN